MKFTKQDFLDNVNRCAAANRTDIAQAHADMVNERIGKFEAENKRLKSVCTAWEDKCEGLRIRIQSTEWAAKQVAGEDFEDRRALRARITALEGQNKVLLEALREAIEELETGSVIDCPQDDLEKAAIKARATLALSTKQQGEGG